MTCRNAAEDQTPTEAGDTATTTATAAPAVPETPYDRIGGEEGIRRLTRRFYELMDSLPEAAACRAVHPPSLERAEQRLFEYLSGWLGGPPLFIERHGHPMLRRRHFVARIDSPEIEGWLVCFTRAWAETVEDRQLGAAVLPQVVKLAQHMRNA